ncbi:12080_t:CDS:2 [Acaulospora morrowiae]|uniref:12080_t:CDS:1 n=1 Tax=Acaulospora morrowiae TaxID=94023 RepID=A0A9N9BEU3_9GLOM|nr:12080_t:CDS:2 [Acaulospora morrowiae]
MTDRFIYSPPTPSTPSYKETEYNNELTTSLKDSNDVYRNSNRILKETIEQYQRQLTAASKDYKIIDLELKTERKKNNQLKSDLQLMRDQLRNYEADIKSLRGQNTFFSDKIEELQCYVEQLLSITTSEDKKY